MACVTPIYKGKGSKSDPSNYRPISITTTISKLFESIVKNQLSDYFANNNLFSPNQSAFLKGRSTQTALHSFTDYLAANINKGYVSAVCTLDMAKGFDCINHEILLNKLAFYGLDLTSVNWFKSYLTDRVQKVKYDGVSSSELPIIIGVPQGSIMGHLLFIIYILMTCPLILITVNVKCMQMILPCACLPKICIHSVYQTVFVSTCWNNFDYANTDILFSYSWLCVWMHHLGVSWCEGQSHDRTEIYLQSLQ